MHICQSAIIFSCKLWYIGTSHYAISWKECVCNSFLLHRVVFFPPSVWMKACTTRCYNLSSRQKCHCKNLQLRRTNDSASFFFLIFFLFLYIFIYIFLFSVCVIFIYLFPSALSLFYLHITLYFFFFCFCRYITRTLCRSQLSSTNWYNS